MSQPTFRVVYQAQSLEEFRALMAEFPALQSGGNGVSKCIAPANGEKGANEIAYSLAYGRPRLTADIIALCGLTGTREDMLGKFKAMRDSNAVIKTATGYVLNDGEKHTAMDVPADDEESDTFA